MLEKNIQSMTDPLSYIDPNEHSMSIPTIQYVMKSNLLTPSYVILCVCFLLLYIPMYIVFI